MSIARPDHPRNIEAHIRQHGTRIGLLPGDHPYSLDILGRAGDLAWTPIAGCLSVAITRRLVYALDDGWDSFDLVELAAACGVGRSITSHSPIVRGLARAMMFRLIEWDDGIVYAQQYVRTPPYLATRQVSNSAPTWAVLT